MSLHIFRANKIRRTRARCPFHKQLEYGQLQEFYDTQRVFFDCGTFWDVGYGQYKIPPEVTRARAKAARERRKVRLRMAEVDKV